MSFTNSQTDGGVSSWDRMLWIDPSGHLVYGVYPGSMKEVISTGTYNDGNWHQAVATIGPNGEFLYVDGSQVAANTSVTSAQNYTGYWHLGYSNAAGTWTDGPSSDYFNGSLAQAAVFPAQLNATQVASLFATSSAQGEASATLALTPTSYWPITTLAWTSSWTSSCTPGTTGPQLVSIALIKGGATVATTQIVVNSNSGMGSGSNSSTGTGSNGSLSVIGLSPTWLNKGASSQVITISGSGFGYDTSVSFLNPGVTVNQTSVLSASKVAVNVSVSSTANVGWSAVTVKNGSTVASTPGSTSLTLPSLTDLSGNNNTGTANGGVTIDSSGPLGGQAIAMDGLRGTYVSTVNSYTNPLPLSQSIWFKTTSSGSIMSFTNSQTDGGLSSWDRMLWIDPSGHVVYGVYPNATKEVVSPGTYNDGNWHQAVATIGPNGEFLYVDGSQVVANTSVVSAQSYTGYWHLGYSNATQGWPDGPSSNYFNGSLGHAAVYPSQLTATQVASLFAANTAQSEASAVLALAPTSYWPLSTVSNCFCFGVGVVTVTPVWVFAGTTPTLSIVGQGFTPSNMTPSAFPVFNDSSGSSGTITSTSLSTVASSTATYPMALSPSSTMTVPVQVNASASPGVGTVTVYNPDGSSGAAPLYVDTMSSSCIPSSKNSNARSANDRGNPSATCTFGLYGTGNGAVTISAPSNFSVSSGGTTASGSPTYFTTTVTQTSGDSQSTVPVTLQFPTSGGTQSLTITIALTSKNG